MIVTENNLDDWVRGNSREAQGVVVELVYRLVAASAPKPKERRFPLPDSIGQPGPDGLLDVEYSLPPFVPEGRSFWEIGTGLDAGAKATSDYKDRTDATPENVRRESTIVFVTPLSGRRDWQYTWKDDAQGAWLQKRRKRNEWKDVRVLDGTRIIDWLYQFPAVESWLARAMRLPADHLDTPEQLWNNLRTVGEPPPLPPHVFLANRDDACSKLKELFAGDSVHLRLDTRYPDQILDFVSAYVASLDTESRVDIAGRCLIISNVDAWNVITTQRERHVLVVDPRLDMSSDSGVKLLEKAKRNRHAVIYCGAPGGVNHPNAVPIPNPKMHQVKEALEKAGYKEERARIVSRQCGGNIGSLLRCLQNASLMPAWVENSTAADLAVAEFLGSWNEKSDSDRAVVEGFSGKTYGEWIGVMRQIALRQGTPLIQREGVWKFVSRYEGWFALGPHIFDDQIDRFRKLAVEVLREVDPQFELPAKERFAAAIHDKVLKHSRKLRQGIAETLALLGSHPKALSSCSPNKAEAIAILAVRDILTNADWKLWASVNDLLPLLAEASPLDFLDSIDHALMLDPCPFVEVFAQEGDAFTGGNYMTGLLWALETLAWDENCLVRVITILGNLAALDPGGRWSNRPANSLVTILLPWMPQTCASIEKRKAAVQTLLKEAPEVAWKLLLNLLPQAHSSSMHTRRPAWRELIPEDWTSGVSNQDYWKQVTGYAQLAVTAATRDVKRAAQIIDHIDSLPPPAREEILTYLASDALAARPESERLGLWTEIVDLVSRHRKFASAEWAMAPAEVDRLAQIAEKLAPNDPVLRHQRLFSDREHDLFEEKGDYRSQLQELAKWREAGIRDIEAHGGVQAVLEFATVVQTPWRVGVAFGSIADDTVDIAILPQLLTDERKPLTLFAGGFINARHKARGWSWADNLNLSRWDSSQIGQFLAFLPFNTDTWRRAAKFLENDEGQYWSRVTVDPFGPESEMETAAGMLVKYGRPLAALRCMHGVVYDKHKVRIDLAVRALLDALHTKEPPNAIDTYEIVKIIQALQNDPATNPDDLFRIEWAYLSLLDRDLAASPKTLEERLAHDPAFFCEVIRLIYRSGDDESPKEDPSEQKKSIATNAYHLLRAWRSPPGCSGNGAVNESTLTSWLTIVKESCANSGHLEVALISVGHVLVYSPPDPDGLWIHRIVANILNAKDSDLMREGFSTELYNSRGVHSFTHGQEEMKIAAGYREKAKAVDSAGFPRLAATLMEMASSYTRDAERDKQRDPFDD